MEIRREGSKEVLSSTVMEERSKLRSGLGRRWRWWEIECSDLNLWQIKKTQKRKKVATVKLAREARISTGAGCMAWSDRRNRELEFGIWRRRAEQEEEKQRAAGFVEAKGLPLESIISSTLFKQSTPLIILTLNFLLKWATKQKQKRRKKLIIWSLFLVVFRCFSCILQIIIKFGQVKCCFLSHYYPCGGTHLVFSN